MNFLMVFLLSFTIPTFPTTPTTPHYASNVIIVEETLTGKVWDAQLRSAITYVDTYTGRTRMAIGTCDRKHTCLHIKFGNPGTGRIGLENTGKGTITLRKSWYGYDLRGNTRRNSIIHELGHYFGLGHNLDMCAPSCTGICIPARGSY
jgi:hypothetical protein